MAAQAHLFGIRHHGPGSARRLVEALDALKPVSVLIEGPADLSDLLPMLASADMVPPVALLAYPVEAPEQAAFWPLAVFSPEYQAARWALAHGAAVRFIDLPAGMRMAAATAADDAENDRPDSEADEPAEDAAPGLRLPDPLSGDPVSGDPLSGDPLSGDPIGTLARAAGYEDGESWWRDVIEENPAPGPVFAAVADAMTALRAEAATPDRFEAAREAHMRLEIAGELKSAQGPVAVVCGAWHVPALAARQSAKDDRAALKGAAKVKIAATWAPWTAPRLASSSGYGAGVSAPGWCRHLWEAPPGQQTTRWVGRIARALRAEGHMVSTAALIETERLAVALAALRGRPLPGFEELRDAAIACLCFGERLLWQVIAHDLLIGTEVGSIPDDVPLAPLLEDFQRQCRAVRLKPEALERELALDLRSDGGLARSTLLHRLAALDVPWGRPADAGRSRGTFRERWVLRWEPEFAVALVENLAHGATIAQAAAGRLAAAMRQARGLGDLADLVFAAMTAQLGEAAAVGIALLSQRAAQTSDCAEMLGALPPLADVLRYGKARATDTGQLGTLFARIAAQGALALPHAVRGLDDTAAAMMRETVAAADAAIRLSDGPDDTAALWQGALGSIVADRQSARLVAGAAARLLYEAEAMTPDAAVGLMARMLSPGTAVADAAAFFAGFFEGSGQKLLHDAGLRGCVDGWLADLDADSFTEYLPLFRRVFSGLDRTERRRLLDLVLGRGEGLSGRRPAPDAAAVWSRHLGVLKSILGGRPADE